MRNTLHRLPYIHLQYHYTLVEKALWKFNSKSLAEGKYEYIKAI